MKKLMLIVLLGSAVFANAAETMRVLKMKIAPENILGQVAYPAKKGALDLAQAKEDHWEFNKDNKFYTLEIVLLPRSDNRMTYAIVGEDLGDGEYLVHFDNLRPATATVKKASAQIGKFVLKAEQLGEIPPPPTEEKKAAAAQKGGKKKA